MQPIIPSQPSKRNRASLRRNLFLCLLASQAFRLLADALTPDAYQWYVHDAAMHLCVCVLVGLVAWMVPYRDIAAKCAAFGWLGFELMPLMESWLRPFGIATIAYTISLQCILAIMLATWYLVRSTRLDGDALDDTHLFICRLKPAGPQDVLLAMLGKSGLGGIAIYYRGWMWHYRHGVLVKDCLFHHFDCYVTFRSIEPSVSTLSMLDALVGSRWSPLRNCVTMLYCAIRYGKPLFKIR